jgi:hypothetical protein
MFGLETDLRSSCRYSHTLHTMGALDSPSARRPAEHLESLQTQTKGTRPIESPDGAILEEKGN